MGNLRICGFVVVAGLLANGAWAATVKPNAKAAELTLHSIERLVILKKIEPHFQSKLATLTVERAVGAGVEVPNSAPLPIEPSYSELRRHIFEPKCMGCHKPLDGGTTKVRLDSVAAMIAAGTVVPGKPGKPTDTNHELMSSLTRASRRMPLRGTPLKDLIRGA